MKNGNVFVHKNGEDTLVEGSVHCNKCNMEGEGYKKH